MSSKIASTFALSSTRSENAYVFKNLFKHSVRISSYGCKREVWSARKSCASSYSSILSALQTYLTCVFSVRVEKSTRATTRICTKKPFIEIECKILTTHKKISKRPYWLVKNMPHFILWFEREHLIQVTNNCEEKPKIYE